MPCQCCRELCGAAPASCSRQACRAYTGCHPPIIHRKPIIGREEGLRRGGLAPVRDCLVPRRCPPEAALRGPSSSASSSAASDRPTLGLLLPLLLSLLLLLPWVEASEGGGAARCRAAESCAARRQRPAATLRAALVGY